MAMDTVAPGRAYLSLAAVPGDIVGSQLFRRVGGGRWEQLPVAPTPVPINTEVTSFSIAPSGACRGRIRRRCSRGGWCRSTAASSWNEVQGPFALEAGDFDVVFDRTDPCLVYAVAEARLWKSFDGGVSFTPGPLGQLRSVRTGTFIADNRDPGTLYVVDQVAGVLKTTDVGADLVAGARCRPVPAQRNLRRGGGGGRSGRSQNLAAGREGPRWYSGPSTAAPPGQPARPRSYATVTTARVFIDPRSRNVVYTGHPEVTGGWFRSFDRGASWSPLANPVLPRQRGAGARSSGERPLADGGPHHPRRRSQRGAGPGRRRAARRAHRPAGDEGRRGHGVGHHPQQRQRARHPPVEAADSSPTPPARS